MLGQTTWRKRAVSKGAEPDCCYYVRNVERIIAKDDIKLESDPPPDIVVEIDITNSSMRKLSIYAAFGVPEVWRYDGRHVQIHRLKAAQYHPVAGSRFLPGVTGTTLTDAIEQCKAQGQTKAIETFGRRTRRRK
jgi:Uma2 family endonuclease